MSVANLGFAIDSSQAVTAKSNLDKMSAAAGAAEQAQQKLSAASTGANNALARIASGVDQANVMLAKLVAAVEASTVAQTKYVAVTQKVEAANVATARGTEVTAAAMRQTAVATDQATLAMERHNAVARAQAERERARVAAGLDVWGRTPEQQQAHIAATSSRQTAPKQAITPAVAPAPAAVVAPAAQVMATGASGASMFGAALASIVSPAMAVHFALFAIGGAAVEAFKRSRDGTTDTEKALKAHSTTLGLLKQQYGDLGEAMKRVGTIGGMAFTEAQARSSQAMLQASIKAQSDDLSKAFLGGGFFRGGLLGSDTAGLEELLSTKNSPFQSAIKTLFDDIRAGNDGLVTFDQNLNKIFDDLRAGSDAPAALHEELQRLSDAATSAFAVSGKFEPFQAEIDRLLLGLKDGNASISEFASDVKRVGEMKGLQKVADDAILLGKEVVDLAGKLREVELILQRIDRENTRPGLADRRDLDRYVGSRAGDLKRFNEQFDAEQQMVRARTNAERLAAVEAQVRARAHLDGDKEGGLQARVDRALAAERNRQEVERRNAAIERERSQARSIESAEQELSLIGETAGEAARLRYEYSEISRLREEAARRGEKASDLEIAKIRETAAELGKLADQASKLNLRRDLQFERDQLFRSPEQQEIAGRLRSAGLPEDFGSVEAGLIRANIQLERMKSTWESIFDVASDGVDTVVDALFDGTTSIGEALKQIGRDFARTMFDLAITNPMKNWLTGGDLASIADLGIFGDGASSGRGGQWGGVLGGLLGAQKAVASMQVQAATVVVNGGVLGAAGGIPGVGSVSRLLPAGNDNFLPPRALAGAGPPNGSLAGDIGTYASAIKSIESGGRYNALGPLTGGDRAYGAYQVMGANVGPWTKQALGYSMAPQDFLDSPGAQDAVFKKIFGGYVDKFGASGAAQAWFGGPGSVGKVGRSDVLGTTVGGYSDKFMEAVNQLGGVSDKAGEAIGQMATNAASATQGLGQLGNSLVNVFPPAPTGSGGGGGGLFGWLGNLFGGGGAAGASAVAHSPQAMKAIASGVGLFEKGGYTGSGANDEAAGIVHRNEYVFDAAATSRIGVADLEAMRKGIMPARRGSEGRASGGQPQQGGGMSAANVESIVNAISKKLSFNVKNVNVLDPSVVGDYLRTEEGERLIMNVQRRNG